MPRLATLLLPSPDGSTGRQVDAIRSGEWLRCADVPTMSLDSYNAFHLSLWVATVFPMGIRWYA
jgi:hypothetical protein